MSHYGNYIRPAEQVHERQQIIKVDLKYSELVSRKIIAEYIQGLLERVEGAARWLTKAAYYIGSSYVIVSLAAPGRMLIPVIHVPMDRLRVLEVMTASRYTVVASAAGLMAHGFVSWVLLPFARRMHKRYTRDADEYVELHAR